jgi:glycosyltransferase involved in cell wall biosynthesis
MRVLFVSAYPPSRLHARSFGFVTQLAQRHELMVICLCHSPRDITDVSRLRALGVQVTPVFEERRHAIMRAAAAVLSERPLEMAYDAAPQLREAVQAEVKRGGVGIVHVEHLRAAGAVAGLPIPLVWDAVDCLSERWRVRREREAYLGLGTHPRRVKRALKGIEQRRVSDYERRLIGMFERVLVESPYERQALLRAVSTDDLTTGTPMDQQDGKEATSPFAGRVEVISTGVDLDYFSPRAERRHLNRLVFSGRMNDAANVAAADLLVNTILPAIWRERPDVQLTITGCNPPRQVRAYANDPRITVTGYVDDVRPYLAGAALAVSPLPYPTGIHNPALEAMAMGTPLIASESAVAGLSIVPGRDLLLASSTERFAYLALRLLDDGELRHSLARNGRAYVERYHSWPLMTRRLEQVYREASGYNFTQATSASFAMPQIALSPLASGW